MHNVDVELVGVKVVEYSENAAHRGTVWQGGRYHGYSFCSCQRAELVRTDQSLDGHYPVVVVKNCEDG
eukprot:4391092-Amphidinium_carterae.2